MTDIELETDGFADALDELRELRDAGDSDRRFLIGTGVEYALFLEFGTSEMDAKPFFQPVINEVATQGVGTFIRQNTETTLAALDDIDRILAVLALAMERRIKEVITQKGLVDTGTLRASVVAVPGVDASNLPTADDFSGFDAENPAPPSAGRAVTEAIEVDL
jgi:hypothetical protein